MSEKLKCIHCDKDRDDPVHRSDHCFEWLPPSDPRLAVEKAAIRYINAEENLECTSMEDPEFPKVSQEYKDAKAEYHRLHEGDTSHD